jgi:hypothetical protein
MIYRCAMCGRKTAPFVFIGAIAIGPTCARKAGMVPAKAAKGSMLRFANPVRRDPDPQTMELFSEIEQL